MDIVRSYSLHLDVQVNHCSYAGCATAVMALPCIVMFPLHMQ